MDSTGDLSVVSPCPTVLPQAEPRKIFNREAGVRSNLNMDVFVPRVSDFNVQINN